ncbi:MAG: hypothetical protein IT374_12240 [Polyangiaceae bacterium]|nr:hypothetical protein [Polyangiaceae bacterium]
MRRASALLVALALAGCRDGRGRDGASPQASSEAAEAPRFARGQLEAHFAKHGAELGAATKEEYLARAQALVRGGPGIDALTQADGDTCFFEEATGELAVVSARRVLRTYFKPRDGRRYFERQRGR